MPYQTIPFAGESYQDKTVNANCQRSINLYPMKTPVAQYSSQKLPYKAPERIIMYPTPGYKFAQACVSYATNGTAIRGLYVINATLYIVVGNELISFVPTGGGSDLTAGTFTKLGTLNTSSGIVSIICNTVQLAISDGSYGYTYTFATTTFATIGSSGSFPASGGVTNLTFYDGYAIAAINNSSEVIQSNVLDASTWGAQAFDKITSFPDNIVAVFSDELNLYVFGSKLCEVQYDVGSIPYAFQKQAGVLIQTGCAAANSIVKIGNTFMWLASDLRGKAFVAALKSYSADPVSTPPINELLERQSQSNIQNAYAFSYREGDNEFYVLTIGSLTIAYDIKMQMWHERSINGGADLPTAYVTWQGNHVVGDQYGNLLLMSQNYTTWYDGSTTKDVALSRIRTCQHLNADGRTMFIEELWVDMQQGGGFVTDSNLATQPASGTAPLVTLEASKDYGNTWRVVGVRTLGAQGKYATRVFWRKLGRFRQDAVFRLTIADPVYAYVLGARANIRVGVK